MSVPDENLTKCTLLVQRCPQAFFDNYTVLFPLLTSFIRQIIREGEDMIMKLQGITKHFL